jgi:hypothetical protein
MRILNRVVEKLVRGCCQAIPDSQSHWIVVGWSQWLRSEGKQHFLDEDAPLNRLFDRE